MGEGSNKAGYVYVLKACKPHDECYKIGRTNNPKRRLQDFGVKLPFKVDVVAYWWVRDCWEAERELHETFKSFRIDGEWFKLSPTAVAWLRALALNAEAVNLVDRMYQVLRLEFDHFALAPAIDAARFYRLVAAMRQGMERISRRADAVQEAADAVTAEWSAR